MNMLEVCILLFFLVISTFKGKSTFLQLSLFLSFSSPHIVLLSVIRVIFGTVIYSKTHIDSTVRLKEYESKTESKKNRLSRTHIMCIEANVCVLVQKIRFLCWAVNKLYILAAI